MTHGCFTPRFPIYKRMPLCHIAIFSFLLAACGRENLVMPSGTYSSMSRDLGAILMNFNDIDGFSMIFPECRGEIPGYGTGTFRMSGNRILLTFSSESNLPFGPPCSVIYQPESDTIVAHYRIESLDLSVEAVFHGGRARFLRDEEEE